jgi:demethylmenaquinone methyltransferase/2-methoxy-6-polyprenyl-1,4-benzoquinol methylase
MTNTTDFGFKTVALNDKKDLVKAVFSSVADNYDLMNDAMSLFVHRAWKAYTLKKMAVRHNERVLDLAGGSGDFTLALSKTISNEGKLVLSDINPAMLKVARNRLIDHNQLNVDIVEADAEKLPFENNAFDKAIMAFGLRNVTDKAKALRELHRVTQKKVFILEFSTPTSKPFAKAYDWYSFNVLPFLGDMIAGDAESYQYLAESIRRHPNQETLKTMMLEAGFSKVEYTNLTGGVVALHVGWK